MKKLLKITGIIVLFILAVMVLLPFVFKGKLVQFAKDEINKNVNAQVDFSDAGLSLFKSFPDFNLGLKGLQIIGNDKFSQDTLAYMDALSIDIDLFSVFKGSPYEIKKITLDHPVINIITLIDESVNYDIALESDNEEIVLESDSANQPFTLNVDKVEIKKGKLVYDDRSLDFKMLLDDMNGNISGNLNADLAEIQTNLTAESLSVFYEGFEYLAKVKADFSSLVVADFLTRTYTLKNTKAYLNQLLVNFEGNFVLGEQDYKMNFSFKSADDNFKNLLSLIPMEYMRQLDQVKTNGSFALTGYVRGIYNDNSYPGFGIDLSVDQASIQYPDLPESIDNIFLTLKIDNKSGILDQTLINLDQIKMKIAGNPLSASFHLKTPVSNPDFDMNLVGKLDLGSLAEVMPLKPEESITGKLDFDFSLKAKMSDIENKRYQQIAAKGSLLIDGLQYNSAMFGFPIEIKKVSMDFSPATIELSQMDVLFGKSDFSISGRADDFLPYYLNDGTLIGKLNLKSDLIDINQILAGMISDKVVDNQSDTTKLSLVLPEKIDFNLTAEVKKIVYEKYELSNAVANIEFKNQVINFNPLQADLNGGSMKMEGMFDGSDSSLHAFDFNFAIQEFDFYKSYQSIGLIQKIAPIVEKTKGQFSAGFRLKGKMDTNLNLNYETLQGGGKLQTSQISVTSVKVMEQLADLLGNEKYKSLNTDGVNLSLEILNGKVYQKPFKLRYADSDVTIGGNVGFDQKLDFDLVLQIPFNALGNKVQDGIGNLITAGANLGIPIDPGTSVSVKVKINGLISNPKVSLDYKDFLSDRKSEISNKINEALDQQKEQLKQKASAEAGKLLAVARKEGDLLIAEAKNTAEKIHTEAVKTAELAKNEANKQADKLVEEVGEEGMLATLAAKEAAKKIRIEGDKTASMLIQEADAKANSLVDQAQKKADELLQKAQEEADKISGI